MAARCGRSLLLTREYGKSWVSTRYICSTLSVTALFSTGTDQLPMTEADTPPSRSRPPSILLFLGWKSPHWKHLSSRRHTAVNNYPFHGCYLDFVGILRTLVDESLKPCQKLKQQYLSFFEKPTNYLSFNPIPGWQVLPILTQLVQLSTQQIFELVTAFYWTQNHRVSVFCRLSHRPKTNWYKYLWCKSEKGKIKNQYFWFPEPLPLVDIRPV